MVVTWQVPTCVVQNVEFALVPLAGDAAEPLELVATQGVQPLVPRSVLDTDIRHGTPNTRQT